AMTVRSRAHSRRAEIVSARVTESGFVAFSSSTMISERLERLLAVVEGVRQAEAVQAVGERPHEEWDAQIAGDLGQRRLQPVLLGGLDRDEGIPRLDHQLEIAQRRHGPPRIAEACSNRRCWLCRPAR